MKQVILVFIGGGLGSALRYLISIRLNPILNHFYLGTFLVNIIGCLLIGLLLGLGSKEDIISPSTSLLLATGFCGGFTTFSTFAFEKYDLLKAGNLMAFSLYLGLSVIVGIISVALGLYFSKSL
ncbi:fluoride efflux transporter CrcB [Croceivirga thetidis]|uniref:Fluoride-specific ion channel FluC n=1 Tax=Croceivirga thetidis TaxID=2721623 RepID=A0ABX1GVD2_9FLAO|nr:fluoride efflux transporter CrcB [Croceivirga thetidis]NKI32996.1 fluoride efflux transporter CrcB [Croceivirga thetidis]